MKQFKQHKSIVWCIMCICMLLVTSCSDDDKVPDGFFEKKSLTDVFIMPKSHTNGESAYTLNINQYQNGGDVYFYVEGEHIGLQKNKKLFNRLLKKYNDHFPKPELIEKGLFGDPIGSNVLGEEIRSIEIKSLDDFNATHKAGADMGDVIYLEWVSYYDYIQGGYERSALNGNGPYLTNGMCHDPKATYHGLIGDTSIYPIKMVDLEPYTMPSLFFSKKPDAPGEYRFEVKFKFETCEATTTMTLSFS